MNQIIKTQEEVVSKNFIEYHGKKFKFDIESTHPIRRPVSHRVTPEEKPKRRIIQREIEVIRRDLTLAPRLIRFVNNKILKKNQLIKANKRRVIYKENYTKINNKIKKASTRLKEIEDLDIPEEIWNFSKKLLMDIYKNFWETYKAKFPIPVVSFIDDSVEIIWDHKEFEILLNITEDFEDIAVYLREKESIMRGYISKDIIVQRVINCLIQTKKYWIDF